MNKIAIIGISCLFPGATTPAEYWQNLVEKKNYATQATEEQMAVDPQHFFAPDKGADDRVYCLQGGFVREFHFDPTGYSAPAEYLDQLDTLYQWPLYTARQALLDSGYFDNTEVLKKCGVVAGVLSLPSKFSHRVIAPIYYEAINAPLQQYLHPNWRLADLPSAGRPVAPLNTQIAGLPTSVIAQSLSLGGVHYSLDAACASSLYAVKLACQQLLSGEMDLMLAGAVSGSDPVFVHLGFSIFQAYSLKGRSRPFDEAADGLISGEGAGFFVLKRYEDAVRDGDHIYATILGAGLSNDGRGKFLLSPLPQGQILAYERAYADAGIDPATIDYLECHATGTPLGDKTELGTIDQFFGSRGADLQVGSAKSNFGHLLTAAGMAGMLKVILSMAHEQIPPTINLDRPRTSPNKVINPHKIVQELTPWPAGKGGIRRAGVSAFGFGGCNAHLILEEPRPGSAAPGRDPQKPLPALAVVGMDGYFAGCRNITELAQTIYTGQQHFVPVPTHRWRGMEGEQELLQSYGLPEGQAPLGGYIEQFDFDFLNFRIPPNPSDLPIPQQLIMLPVADNALKDSGIAEGSNVAVLVAIGTELESHQIRGRVEMNWQIRESLKASGLNLPEEQITKLEKAVKDSIHHPAQLNQYTSVIGNLIASRISSKWDFTGPSFTLSSEENSVFKAIQVAQLMLAEGEVEAVLVGAVDLAGSAESVLLRQLLSQINSSGQFTLSFADGVNGWNVGEGAGAIVLKRVDQTSGQKIYATIEGIGMAQEQLTGQFPAVATPDTVQQASQKALAQAKISPAEVGYLEVYGSGLPAEDEAEITALTQLYQGEELTCALGSVKANIGHTFVASGMASLLKTILCLHQRVIPPVPSWTTPKELNLWQGSRFYVPTEVRPWFIPPTLRKRYAAVNSLGLDGTAMQLILAEPESEMGRTTPYLTHLAPYLFPVVGNNSAELLAGLQQLREETGRQANLLTIAQTAWHHSQTNPAAYTIALVAGSAEELNQQITQAEKGIPAALSNGKEWKTPQGSVFAPQPVGKKGSVAFVYPGAFNSYVGVGQDLFQLFPQLYETFVNKADNAQLHWGDKYVFLRSMVAPTEEDIKEANNKLMASSPTLLESGMSYATVITQVVRDVLKIKPAGAFGYSLGECSLMFGLGGWSVQNTNSDYLHQSELFHTTLTGRKTLIRSLWQLGPEVADDFWHIYTLKTTPEKAQEALQGEERVYLTHVNAPKKVVIAGDAAGCQRVIAKLKCPAVKAPYSQVIHCDPMRPAYDEFLKLNNLPVHPIANTKLYFTADDQLPNQYNSDTINHKIATNMCQPLDFQKLVQRVYDDGARIFIECGVGTSCSGWIGENLGNLPHVAVPANRPGKDDRTSLILMLANLLTHQVEMDLTPLYGAVRPAEKQGIVKQVRLGGQRIRQHLQQHIPPLREQLQVVQQVTAPGRYQPIHLQPVRVNRPQPVPQMIELTPAEEWVTLPAVLPALQTATAQMVASPLTTPQTTTERITNGMKSQTSQLREHVTQINQNHALFLQSRQEALEKIGQLISAQIGGGNGGQLPPTGNGGAAGNAIQRYVSPEPPPQIDYTIPANVIWDEKDLLEFAGGKISNVFGPQFAEIDNYKRIVRLPLPPYLLVSRVTELRAEVGKYQPSFIQTEYDIPLDAWYQYNGQAPLCVFIESGQCDLMLISYLGIDFQNKGELMYRLLDCTLIPVGDLPMVGETLRYDISINNFARSGKNLLFFFSYNCYIKDKLVLKMRGGCAGFFSDKDLAAGKGIVRTDEEIAARAQIEKKYFEPLLVCEKTAFSREELVKFTQGRMTEVFGPHYDQYGYNPSLHFSEPIMMMDRITHIDPHGGVYGLGLIEAEKDLLPDDWYFPCHFKDDEVLAGSLVAEGCSQLLQFFFVYMGMHTSTVDARFQPIYDLVQAVRCRGQITAEKALMVYRVEVKEIGMEPDPYLIVDIDILLNGKVVVDFKNMGLRIKEKALVAEQGLKRAIGPDGKPLGTSFVYAHLNQKAESKPAAPAIVPRYAPAKPTFYTTKQVEEFATGTIANCFGPEYEIFNTRHTSRTPNGDLMLIHRIIGLEATRHKFTVGSHLTAEYDVPVDPWWARDNNNPVTIPYSVYMELGLQPCGFLSAHLGSSMLMDVPLYFRNLDGKGTVHNLMDLRGRTLENKVKLTSMTNFGGTILQHFEYNMTMEGTPIFSGTSSFGYFTHQSLADQVGLDRGQDIRPWYEAGSSEANRIEIKLNPAASPAYYTPAASQPHYHLPVNQLNYLDRVLVVPQGGKSHKGYVYGEKLIDTTSWFFKAHFYGDPVMPGSLGVEAMLEALQAYAMQQGLGKKFRNPRFEQALGHTIVWKYRGQIIPRNKLMYLELHITDVKETAGQTVIYADANLWRDNMRIYEVKQLALQILEG